MGGAKCRSSVSGIGAHTGRNIANNAPNVSTPTTPSVLQSRLLMSSTAAKIRQPNSSAHKIVSTGMVAVTIALLPKDQPELEKFLPQKSNKPVLARHLRPKG